MEGRHHVLDGMDLVATFLITRSRPGPRLVFHYPARPNRQSPGSQLAQSTGSDTDSDDDVHGTAEYATQSRSATSPSGLNRTGNDIASGKGDLTAGNVLGIPIEALEKFLCPGRWCDRKKFEVCLNGLTFVGYPMYSSDDGNWSDKAGPDVKSQSRHESVISNVEDISNTAFDRDDRALHDFAHVPESLDSQTGLGLGASADSNSTMSGTMMEQMTMFHVVFALGATYHENHHNNVAAIYQDVAKKLSKAMHYCQKQANYVALESQRLLSLIAKSKQRQITLETLWTEMVESSELAWALKELHDRISRGSVATLRLGGMPISLRTSHRSSAPESHPGPFSALLLLESKDALLRSLSHHEASPLVHLIREHTATKNLYKHSTNLSMPLSDVLYLAHHLTKWRKACIIAPLHQRNTYVVNPSLNVQDLRGHMEAYSRAFPTLPSLPNMLKVLSGKPIKYGVLIPSRDHRGPYMDILAFLVRHELVVQLKTYGWLRMPARMPPTAHDDNDLPGLHKSRQHAGKSAVEPAATTMATTTRRSTSPNVLSPHLRPSTLQHDDDSISISSDRTAIAANSRALKRLSTSTQIAIGDLRALRLQNEQQQQQQRRDRELEPEDDGNDEDDDDDGESDSNDDGNDDNNGSPADKATLLRHPSRLSARDARRVASIRAQIEDAELREHFEALLPFFDGRHAFEETAARLQLKRAKVEEWIAELDRRGWLLLVRHV